MSSNPRPIHSLHRTLVSTPDEAEPSFSYEQESFLGGREVDQEDEFHIRLAARSRRESGGSGHHNNPTNSFWRTASTGGGEGPSLRSVSLKKEKNETVKERKSAPGGLLGGDGGGLQSHFGNGNSGDTVDNDRGVNSSRGSRDSWSDSRRDSSMSLGSASGGGNNSTREGKKKDAKKQRAADRRHKLDALASEVEAGHIEDQSSSSNISVQLPDFSEMKHGTFLDRSSSDQSTGSLLYGKTPSSGTLLGKSSSLIFPTGVDSGNDGVDSESAKLKRRKINLALDQCEAVRFRFKKKLILSNMDLSASDIPLKDLCGTSLGNSLHKLSLAGNRLGTVPPRLVQNLPVLKTLDLSQCELSQLPDRWNLPKLATLNLSHNGFTEFPEESMLEGLPELQDLNMYGNKVAEIIIPPDRPKILAKLEKLDLGYNDLVYLPAELDQLKSLKTLRVMNNFLNKIPMRVCEMDLKSIDVSSNPVTEPPAETCERGIASMRRYWQCIRLEEQTKQKALEAEAQRKTQRPAKKQSAKKSNWTRLIPSKPKPSPVASAKKNSDNRAASTASSADVVPVPVVGASVAPSPAAPLVTTPLSKRAEREGSGLSSSMTSQGSEGATTKLDVERQDSVDSAVGYANTHDPVSVNDTLKVIFVGMAMVGKTSMIKRLIEGEDAVVPTREERTVGVDIYQWDPKADQRFEHIDSLIEFQDAELAKTCGDVDVKFSVWDFAGQHVYHATHELFFSPRALYVLVWDMGATNPATWKRGRSTMEKGAFSLSIDSDDEDDEDDFEAEEEARRADRALERDIDEKVQFWVDCIQSSAPGAAILPVASFADYFGKDGEAEAKRRCKILKQRLLKHEERRKMGIKERLKAYVDQNRADDLAAIRLRKLMCSYTRPKLIFGDTDDDSVVRVSGTQFTGFDILTERVISIATGRYKGQWRYPIFHGHVGARIPRMRLEVREEVRQMREKFKVVEWGHFINKLRDRGLTNIEDISDALHFLTNTGELAYFGGVMTNSKPPDNPLKDGAATCGDPVPRSRDSDEDMTRPEAMDDYVDDDQAVLSMDDTSITSPITEDGSLTTVEDFMSSGLSEFVFLNPRWLVAAVACILRHDLDREIKETRRAAAAGGDRQVARAASFYEAHLNCPVITADDACLLWQGKRITKKAAKLAQEYSNNMTVTPFEFLQLLLIRFGVFVPIDLTIEKAFLGGKEYARVVDSEEDLECSDELAPATEVTVVGESDEPASQAKFFFLPSLLGPCEPSDAWSFKTTESWKTTLCHSILYPDGVPPGLMERLTASVLSSMYAVTSRKEGNYSSDQRGQEMATYEGHMTVKEILCWRTAFYIKIGTLVPTKDGKKQESIVEIFTHLADRDSHLCVGSDYMSVGMRRLITSGRGQAGDGGRKIWKGGYLLVVKCIQRVMEAYGGLEFERQGFCNECLGKRAVSEASAWDLTTIRAAVKNSEEYLRCHHGHRVDTRLVAGPQDKLQRQKSSEYNKDGVPDNEAIVPVQDLLRGVVVVGLWDGKTRKVVRVGSGFIADKKRGLIVTASHTLVNIWGDRKYPYGENYYGLPHGKVVVGIIPEKETDGNNAKDMAVFRYFAKIVTKDASLDQGECHLDACVLRITTRMENDVGGNGDGCGDQPEILLLNDEKAMKREGLQSLKITEKSELDEQVRILGYNQGGEGLLQPGENLNRYVDFAKGYVCMKFAYEEQDSGATAPNRPRFKPRDEIVVICPTIGGHSGGPCVNQQGEVIGILSRADPADSQRCYISPAYEWKSLVKAAKYKI